MGAMLLGSKDGEGGSGTIRIIGGSREAAAVALSAKGGEVSW